MAAHIWAWYRRWLVLCLVLMATACGGGGGTTDPAPVATPVPQELSISAPERGETGVEVRFGNSAAALAGLSFNWTFGDGAVSSAASPSHRYMQSGSYEVRLKVSNAAGQSREVQSRLTVSALANVQGLPCSADNNGGWCLQRSPPGFRFIDVAMANATTGWTLDELGRIRKTIDGGVTWSLQRSNPGRYSVLAFRTALDGWALGVDGALRTTDGGVTWTKTNLPELAYPEVRFVNERVMFVQGGDSKRRLYGTTDGGVTWSEADTAGTSKLDFSPDAIVWNISSEGLSRSVDMGKSFTRVLDKPVIDPTVPLPADEQWLTVIDGLRLHFHVLYRAHVGPGVNASYHYLEWRSDDGGITWRQVESIENPGLQNKILRTSASDNVILAMKKGVLQRSVDAGDTWTKLTDAPAMTQVIDFNGSDFIGRSLTGQIWSSVDAGVTWKNVRAMPGGDPEAVLTRVDAQTLLVEAGFGNYFVDKPNLYISTDRGENWRVLATGASWDVRLQYGAPWFFDAKRGVLALDDDSLWDTADGGKTWASRSFPGTAVNAVVPSKIQFKDERVGWRLRSSGVLESTADGGATWKQLPAAVVVGDFHFADELRGWIKPFNGTGMLLTSDGGQTFVKAGEPSGVQSLRYAPDGRIVGLSYWDIFYSSDAGKSWLKGQSPFSGMRQLRFEGSVAWILGNNGQLARSNDGGVTWTTVSIPVSSFTGLNDIRFANATDGWIVGYDSTILATRDGGATWVRQRISASANLVSVQFTDAKTGWVTSDRGLVFATASAGE